MAPRPARRETDLTALTKGFMTLTPLDYNMTHPQKLAEMQHWEIGLTRTSEEQQGST